MSVAEAATKASESPAPTIDTRALAVYKAQQGVIAEFQEKYGSLTIAGVDDKAGYDRVHKARINVRDFRIAVEKRRVELKQPALDYGKSVDATAKALTAAVKPLEDRLESMESQVDAERERIKQAKARERQRMIEDRVAKMAKVMSFVQESVAGAWSDEEFEAELAAATERKAATDRAEAERQEAIRVENERLERERAELDRQRKQIEEDFAAKQRELKRMESAIATASQDTSASVMQAEQACVAAAEAAAEAVGTTIDAGKEMFAGEDPFGICVAADDPQSTMHAGEVGIATKAEPDGEDWIKFDNAIRVLTSAASNAIQRGVSVDAVLEVLRHATASLDVL